MPPRIQPPSKAIASILRCRKPLRTQPYATATATATLPAASNNFIATLHPKPASRPKPSYPSTQPPSYKPPEFRKTQLLRQYASLLRSTPLMLIFQHNNLKATEWVGVRRELAKALMKVDEARLEAGNTELLAGDIKLQIMQTGIFDAALKVVEFYDPLKAEVEQGGELAHTLSKKAHEVATEKRKAHELAPLLSGPLALLTFPTVSPQHLKAAFSILAPSPPAFPAPTRRANPGYHDAPVQSGVQKLLLMAARVEGKVFDVEGVKWIGGIEGGIEGLRAQLVFLLQNVGSGLTNTLESAGRSLYYTVEGRRTMLEDEVKGPVAEETKE